MSLCLSDWLFTVCPAPSQNVNPPQGQGFLPVLFPVGHPVPAQCMAHTRSSINTHEMNLQRKLNKLIHSFKEQPGEKVIYKAPIMCPAWGKLGLP